MKSAFSVLLGKRSMVFDRLEEILRFTFKYMFTRISECPQMS